MNLTGVATSQLALFLNSLLWGDDGLSASYGDEPNTQTSVSPMSFAVAPLKSTLLEVFVMDLRVLLILWRSSCRYLSSRRVSECWSGYQFLDHTMFRRRRLVVSEDDSMENTCETAFLAIFCGLPQSCIYTVCLSPKSLPQLRYRPLPVFAIFMGYAALTGKAAAACCVYEESDQGSLAEGAWRDKGRAVSRTRAQGMRGGQAQRHSSRFGRDRTWTNGSTLYLYSRSVRRIHIFGVFDLPPSTLELLVFSTAARGVSKA
ncbi:hypothetical protein KCU62_g341, partial [Aureobasidium sp. EXF-3399]